MTIAETTRFRKHPLLTSKTLSKDCKWFVPGVRPTNFRIVSGRHSQYHEKQTRFSGFGTHLLKWRSDCEHLASCCFACSWCPRLATSCRPPHSRWTFLPGGTPVHAPNCHGQPVQTSETSVLHKHINEIKTLLSNTDKSIKQISLPMWRDRLLWTHPTPWSSCLSIQRWGTGLTSDLSSPEKKVRFPPFWKSSESDWNTFGTRCTARPKRRGTFPDMRVSHREPHLLTQTPQPDAKGLTSLPAASLTARCALSGAHVTHSTTCSCSRSSALHSFVDTTHTRTVWKNIATESAHHGRNAWNMFAKIGLKSFPETMRPQIFAPDHLNNWPAAIRRDWRAPFAPTLDVPWKSSHNNCKQELVDSAWPQVSIIW